MVKAYKNGISVIVPYTAYKQLYEPHGWIRENTVPPNVRSAESVPGGTESTADNAETNADSFEDMSMTKLKSYAKQNGIDISQAADKQEAISIIKAAQSI